MILSSPNMATSPMNLRQLVCECLSGAVWGWELGIQSRGALEGFAANTLIQSKV